MQKYFIRALLIIGDLIWLIFIYYITLIIRDFLTGVNVPELININLKNFLFVIFIILILFFFEKIYHIRYDMWQEILRVFKALAIAFLIVFSILALTKTDMYYSRLFIITYFALLFITFPVFKRYFKKFIFKYLNIRENILIVGRSGEKERFINELKANWYLGARYNREKYEKVIIVSTNYSFEELDKIINKYMHKVGDVFIVPYLNHINFGHSNILEFTNLRLNTIELQNKLLIRRNIIIKTVFDRVLSIIVFPFFLLIHMIIALLIKKDSNGEIFYKQERLGAGGKRFKVYKYRTMFENGKEILQEYLNKNPDEVEYYNKYHKYKNDPRITKFGKFLRSSSLDELPQIINILKGDMSFIGPRPYMVEELGKLGDNKDFILKVKPGITGLWQVSGRNELSFKERIDLEKWYIQNWSLWLDFVILVKTVKVVLKKTGAK